MKKFNVLDPELNPMGTYFLEASAGTGKTFAIEHLIPRLLLSSQASIGIDQILVVTFTRAATRELRERVQKNLVTLCDALHHKRGGPKYIQDLFEEEEQWFRAKRILEEARFNFDRAQIFTLHGFALHVLEEFAVESGFCPVAHVQGMDPAYLLRQQIKDFLLFGISEEILSPAQLQRVCKQKGVLQDSEALCQMLLQIHDRGQKIRRYPTAQEHWQKLCDLLASLPRVSSQQLWQDYYRIAPRSARASKWNNQVDAMFTWIEKGGCSFTEFDHWLQEPQIFLSKISKSDHAELVHPDVWPILIEQILPIYEAATDVNILTLQLAFASVPYYEMGKKLSGYQPPDAWIQHLFHSMRSPLFVQKVRNRYCALVIDEFQDTDSMQWGIFHSLFIEDRNVPKSVYLVGDPKQSIYGFRQADVYVYLRAKEAFPQENRLYLGTCYRSHPALVAALNVLFSFDLPQTWLPLPLANEGITVPSLDAQKSFKPSLEDASKGRVHFFFDAGDKKGRSVQWPTKEREEKVFLSYIAHEIIRLTEQEGLFYKNIAILVKDRFQAERVQRACQKYRIPSFVQQSLSLQSDAFSVMKDLLYYMMHVEDLSSLKRILAGPLVGWDAKSIMGTWDHSLFQEAKSWFLHLGSRIPIKGWGAFIYDLLAAPSLRIQEETVAQVLLREGKKALYCELRQLTQILLEYAPQGIYSAQEGWKVIDTLERLHPQEVLQKFSEREEDLVRIMTLHKSKGLEFDVVFALALYARHTGKDAFICLRQEGEIIAQSEQEMQIHQEEMDAEKLRQLYVALTRAKERVYIPVAPLLEPVEVSFGTASPIELFLGARGMHQYCFTEVYQQIGELTEEKVVSLLHPLSKEGSITWEKIVPVAQETRLQPMPLLQKPFVKKQEFFKSFVLSFSSLYAEQEKVWYEGIEESDGVIPAGPKTGVILHAILEKVCKAGLHELQEIIWRLCAGTILDGKEQAVEEMVVATLHKKINTIFGSFSLGDLPAKDLQTEVEFLYPYGCSLMKGFIDLVFRFQGRYFLLDWKTNILPSYTQEMIGDCMKQHRYDAQLAIYTEALRKYLALFDARPFSQIFGGGIYFFLRGNYPFVIAPSEQLIEDIV